MTVADEEPDDQALLREFQDGNEAAFGVLFRRHRDRLWAVALRTTGNREDAADALQEAMVSAFRKAAGFRGDAQVGTWLHRIVVNASLDRLRRNKVRAAEPLPDDLEEYAGRGAVVTSGPPGSPDSWADDAERNPEAHAVAADQRARILAALEQIPPEQKAALVLVDMEGYPVEEAALILACPSGTVKSRCARGRARLADLLRPTGTPGTGAGAAASHLRDPAAPRGGATT